VDIEIICIGNELLIGKTQNTNAYWMGKQATLLGANVKRITIVQDLIDEIAKIVCETLTRKPQFIITTGGLGPTFDDKTLQGLAKALNRKLEVNPEALAIVKEKYAEYAKTRKIHQNEMTPPRVKMATLPTETEPVTNPVGTAPGVRANLQETVMFLLPGVPAEMEAIFTQTITPILKKAVGNRVFCEKSIFLNDIMESQLAPLLDTVMGSNPGVYLKSHPLGEEKKPHIEIHLTIMAKKEDKPQETLQKAIKQLAGLVEANGGEAIVEN
jgi:molybdenum cofactor synthesis domain-containing protein